LDWQREETVAAAIPMARRNNAKAAQPVVKAFGASPPNTLARLPILLSLFHCGRTILIPSLDSVEL
jgi:hypothetical protein